MTEPAGSDASLSAEFGLVFRAAREDAGMTLNQVADVLHLDVAVVSAIEEGRFADLPMRPYARGYVRNYARVLGLDADDLARRFDAADAGRPEPSVAVPRHRVTPKSELALRPLALGYAAIVAVLLIALGAVLWSAWRVQDWQFPFLADDSVEPSAVESATASPAGPPNVSPWPTVAESAADDEAADEGATLPSAEPSGGEREGARLAREEPSAGEREGAPLAREEPSAGEREGEPLARREPSAGEREGEPLARREPSAGEREGVSLPRDELNTRAPAVADEPVASRAQATEPQNRTGEDDEAPSLATESVNDGVPAPAGSPVAARGAVGELTLVFDDDSWVSVDDATGRQLFGDLGRNGHTVTVAGQVPLSILVGNALAVRMEFDGETVDLGPFTRENNVARLELGGG